MQNKSSSAKLHPGCYSLQWAALIGNTVRGSGFKHRDVPYRTGTVQTAASLTRVFSEFSVIRVLIIDTYFTLVCRDILFLVYMGIIKEIYEFISDWTALSLKQKMWLCEVWLTGLSACFSTFLVNTYIILYDSEAAPSSFAVSRLVIKLVIRTRKMLHKYRQKSSVALWYLIEMLVTSRCRNRALRDGSH